MTSDAFHARYAPTSGPVRLGQWECLDAGSARMRRGPQPLTYRATIAFGDRLCTSTSQASGPVAALTAMLHDHGVAVELLDFHQLASADGVATFVRGTDGARHRWAAGMADDSTQSALRAVVACANRLAG